MFSKNFAVCFIAVFILSGCNLALQIPIHSQSQTITDVTLEIKPLGINIPDLSATPNVIPIGQTSVLQVTALKLSSGEVLPNIPCTLTLVGINTTLVVSNETNAQGMCPFDISLTPQEQGWTYISGDQSRLTEVAGVVNATILYNTQFGDITASTTITVTPNQPALNKPVLKVNLTQIEDKQTVIYETDPITYADGSLARNKEIVLTINKGNQVYRFAGKTNQSGVFRIDFAQALNAQGVSVLAGNVSELFNIGNPLLAAVAIEGLQSNQVETGFVIVIGPSIEIPIPRFPEPPRTGGTSWIVTVSLLILGAGFAIYRVTRKRELSK
jgi:hypothetical protein